MFQETLTIAGISKRDIQDLSIFYSLLYPRADRMVCILCFNNSERLLTIGTNKEVISFFSWSAFDSISANNDLPIGKGIFHQ